MEYENIRNFLGFSHGNFPEVRTAVDIEIRTDIDLQLIKGH
jgi:hypothetical protein